jgi:hypothetical protein
MKTYRVELTDDEVRAVIRYQAGRIISGNENLATSKRVHELTKRLDATKFSPLEKTEGWN